MYGKDTLNTKFSFDGKSHQTQLCSMVRRQRLSPPPSADGGGQRPQGGFGGFGGRGAANTELPATATRLSRLHQWKEWNGTGTDSLGNSFTWTASL